MAVALFCGVRVMRAWGSMVIIVLSAAWTLGAVETFDFRRPEIIPEPRELSYDAATPVRIASDTRFSVSCPDATAAAWVKGKIASWFAVKDAVVSRVLDRRVLDGGDEAYELSAEPGRISIAANTLKGMKWAMHSLRQTAACGGWGSERIDPKRRGRPFAKYWRQCGWDMGVPSYEETGFFDRQVTRDALDQ